MVAHADGEYTTHPPDCQARGVATPVPGALATGGAVVPVWHGSIARPAAPHYNAATWTALLAARRGGSRHGIVEDARSGRER